MGRSEHQSPDLPAHERVTHDDANPGIILSTTTQSAPARRLDVWWRGEPANVGLMMLLAHLLNRAPDWRDAGIRLKTLVGPIHPNLDVRGLR